MFYTAKCFVLFIIVLNKTVRVALLLSIVFVREFSLLFNDFMWFYSNIKLDFVF